MKEEKKTLKVNAQHMSVLSSNAKAKEVISFISFCKVLLPSVRDSAASRGVAHARCLLPPFQFFFSPFLVTLLYLVSVMTCSCFWALPCQRTHSWLLVSRLLRLKIRFKRDYFYNWKTGRALSLNDYGRLWPPVRSGSEWIVWTTFFSAVRVSTI